MNTTTRTVLAALCFFAGGCAATVGEGPTGGSIAASSSTTSSQSSSGSHGLLAAGDMTVREGAIHDGMGRGIPMPEPARDPGANAREMPTPQMPIPIHDHGTAAHGAVGYMY